ncbi:M1 family metallopeptidase [Pedobacter antarcticus]|uniref:Peptidase M1 membrane alanine aminopeptidase domain-containing protein n=1 Tax=Pedobacter antarcticus TaxID=34086 RepID=A0A1I2HQ03_9SPHI|nr:M1 family metallopeptidase [Pedobacter antarcticus]SDM00742.1 hypothetical protein SAMN04488084_103238 [Pedobacter antarcticus]SFF31493.1 hypothetical protein SAMN03003324_03263 [Pedobacter antarcticus]
MNNSNRSRVFVAGLPLLLLFFVTGYGAVSQTVLPIPPNISSAYKKGTRDLSGAAGKKYWQNSADYQLKIEFDPASRLLKGKVEIDYMNNSPDTLRQLVFKLYPNLYQKEAMRTVPVSAKDLTSGVKIDAVTINNQTQDSTKRSIRSTNMYVRGVKIPPHEKVHVEIDYNYILNEGSFVRTGQVEPGAFFIAYSFPRIAVYDDIDGWNEYPYTGRVEFYNDYCNFNAEITVPGDYQVWATGELQNTNDVYSEKTAARIAESGKSGEILDITTVQDLKSGMVTRKNKTNTWKFKASHVTDLAFAISNHYVWKASSLVVDPVTQRRTTVNTVFNPEHKVFEPVINYAHKTVAAMSYQFPALPFPYPHITIFEGLDAMEYPMMVNNLPFEDKQEVIQFTMHEIFHTLFPFYVGVNETKYSFMDEGWATLSEFLLYPMVDTGQFKHDISDINKYSGTEEDLPLMTLTSQLSGKARYMDKDLKPALGLHYLKEMLGDKIFLKGLRHYIKEWAGKHPTPYDFFYTMNTGTGVNLDWFWKSWYFEKGVPDLAISKVSSKGASHKVVVGNVGTSPIPIHLTVLFKDGTTQILNASIACWKDGKRSVTFNFSAKKQLKRIVLGDNFDADVNPLDNMWEAR